MQAARGRSDQLGQPMLDMHVDVFERRVFGHAAVRIVVGDCGQSLVNRRRIVSRNDPLFAEHGCVRAAGRDVLSPNPLVGGD